MVIEAEIDIHDPVVRERLFAGLYKNVFPLIAKRVKAQGKDLQAAKDIFQEAIVIFYEKMVSGEMDGIISNEAYLTGIARHLTLRKLREDHKTTLWDDGLTEIAAPSTTDAETDHRLLVLLELTGKRCLDLLKAFYYDKLPLSLIGKRFGFSGERSAASQKYKCIEKMRAMLKTKSLRYEDFLD